MEETLTMEQRKALYFRMLMRLALAALAVWCLVKYFGWILSLILPFLLAYYLAKALNVVVRWLRKRVRVPRRILSFLCVSAMVVALSVVLYQVAIRVTEELTQFVSSWDTIRSSMIDSVNLIAEKLSSLAGRDQAEFQTEMINLLVSGLTWINERISSWSPSVVEQTGSVLGQMFTVFLSCVMFFVACFYLTADFPRLNKLLWSRIPKGLRTRSAHLRSALGTAAGGYLKAQLILSGLVMAFTLIAFLIRGQGYAVLLSLFIAIVDFIPIFGSGTVLIPWAVVALLSGSLGQCVFLLCLSGFLFVFRKVAEPKIVGNQTGLSTLMSLLCIYVGMKLGGVVGMIVAPIVCLMLISLKRAGTFDHVIADLWCIWRDLCGLMKRPSAPETQEQAQLPQP